MSPSDGKEEDGSDFPITVDYRLTLDEMVRAGRYRRVDGNINAEHFPIAGSGVGEYRAVLLDLEKYIQTEQAESEIWDRGLRPARLEELLAFGATYRDRDAMALGSHWVAPTGQRKVPAIITFEETEYSEESRELYLTSAGPTDQHLGVAFLAVRPQT